MPLSHVAIHNMCSHHFNKPIVVVVVAAYSQENRAFADIRYGEEDSVSPSTLICPVTKGKIEICTMCVLAEVP